MMEREAWTAVTRRQFLGAAGTAAATGLVRAAGLAAAEPPPNIVLIVADDLGYSDLSCYGQKRFDTPNVDRLAAEGARFTAHYSGSPVCAPSRCSLLTGLHTGHACIRANDELPERGDVWNDPSLEGQRPLPPGTATIGTLLKGAGYDTALVGKWGLGGPASDGVPTRHGFDHAFGYLCQRQAHNHYPDHLWRNGRRVALDNPSFRAHQRFDAAADPADPRAYDRYQGRVYAQDAMMDEAIAWLRDRGTRPFFLHLAPALPHLALQVPEEGLAPFAGRFPETPYLGEKGYLPHRTPRAAYAAMIARLDAGVGRLMRTLAETGLDSRTLVIFTSDNGATFEAGGYDGRFFESNAPWRGGKQDLYEGGIRVPFIARWPGRVPKGIVRDEPCASWDLAATFADLAGATPMPGHDGVSLRPLLEGRPAAPRAPLYWEYLGKQAVRDGRWKAIFDAPTGVIEVYDLAADPGERRNVARARAGEAARLRQIMRDSRVESSLFPLVKARTVPAA